MRRGRAAAETRTRRCSDRDRPASSRAIVQHTVRAPRRCPPPRETGERPAGSRSQTSTSRAVPNPRAVAVITNPTVSPGRTVERVARLRSVTRGGDCDLASSTWMLPPGSVVGIAVTPLRSVPGAVARATTTTVAVAPGASGPTWQLIGTPEEQVPWLGVTDTI